jgi:hypothetical protein
LRRTLSRIPAARAAEVTEEVPPARVVEHVDRVARAVRNGIQITLVVLTTLGLTNGQQTAAMAIGGVLEALASAAQVMTSASELVSHRAAGRSITQHRRLNP